MHATGPGKPSPSEPQNTRSGQRFPDACEVGTTYSPASGEHQRRWRQQVPYSPGAVEAPAKVDFTPASREEVSTSSFRIAVQALEKDGRIVHFEPVPVSDALGDQIQIELRWRDRPVAEPVSIARNVVLPASKRRGDGHREPRQGVQHVGLARRVGPVDSGDGQDALREAVEPARRRAILVDGDHRQLHRLENRAVVGDPESQQHGPSLAQERHFIAGSRRHRAEFSMKTQDRRLHALHRQLARST